MDDPYQYNFNPNCICRGELPCDVIIPKFALLKSVFGAPQTTRLKILKASMRTSRRNLIRHRDRLRQTDVLRQIPGSSHVAIDARRISQLPDGLNERCPIEEPVDQRIELVAGDRRAPVFARHVRAVRAVENRQRGAGRDADRQTAGVDLHRGNPPSADDHDWRHRSLSQRRPSPNGSSYTVLSLMLCG